VRVSICGLARQVLLARYFRHGALASVLPGIGCVAFMYVRAVVALATLLVATTKAVINMIRRNVGDGGLFFASRLPKLIYRSI
jgi:hypothetical protein